MILLVVMNRGVAVQRNLTVRQWLYLKIVLSGLVLLCSLNDNCEKCLTLFSFGTVPRKDNLKKCYLIKKDVVIIMDWSRGAFNFMVS